MAEQHVKIFQGLGIPQDQIDKIEALKPEELKDFKADDITGIIGGTFKNKFLNDQDFLNSIPEDKVPETTKKKIESGQYARFQKEILETAQKQLGLEDADLADLTDEERKSIKKTVAKVAEKYLGKKGNVEGLKDLQGKLQRLQEDIEKKDADWQGKLDTELQKTNTATNLKLIKVLSQVALSGLEGVEFPVPVPYITDPALARLSAKYAIVLGPNDELELKNKDNPKLDAMENNKKITFLEALKKEALEAKLVKPKEAEGNDGKGRRKTTVNGEEEGGGSGDYEVPAYIKNKIEQVSKLEK